MSKKSILSTLLISSALLGTLSASAATSAIKPEKKLVSVEKSNAKIYKNSKLQESKTVKKGTVYKVDGYRNINSKKYYRVYQEDTKGKVVYKGYILDKDTTVLKGQKPAKKDRLVALTKDDQTAWKSLYFNKKIKTYDGTKHSSNFEVKYSYNIGGKKYFSLYRGEKWMGYMDGSAFKVLTPKTISEDKQDYKVVKDYDTYSDIYFTENGKLKVGEKVKVKRVYTFGTGRQYGSLYNKDGKWMGYANMKALEAIETSIPDKPVTPPEKPEEKPDGNKPGTGGDTSKPDTKPDNPGDKPTEPGKPEQPDQGGDNNQGGSGSGDTGNKPGDGGTGDSGSGNQPGGGDQGGSGDTGTGGNQPSQPDQPGQPDNPGTGGGTETPDQPVTPPEAGGDQDGGTGGGTETPQPGTTLESQIKEVKAEAEKVYLSKDQQDNLDKALEEIGKVTSNDNEKFEKAKVALEKAKKDLATCPTKEEVNKVVKQYNQLKEKCADWKEGQHKDVFSPETEKPFEDALKAIEKVGKANASNGTITKEDLANANKAQEAANNLKFNADLIDKKVNDKANVLVKAAKKLGNDYANNESSQTTLTEKIKKAEEVLGLQKDTDKETESNVNSIKDNTKWNTEGWKAIDSAEAEVVKAGKTLQKELKKPLEEEKTKREKALVTAIESKKEVLRKAINTAEEDLNNNRYEKFAEDKKAIEDAMKEAGTNGSAEAENLQKIIEDANKLTSVPKEVFDSSSNSTAYETLKESYKKAQSLVEDPTVHTEQEMKEAEESLRNAAKALKLNVEFIKTEGQEFQKDVGNNGQGEEYYISKNQKTQLSTAKSKLEETYNKGVSATTVDKYEDYKEADQLLKKALKDVSDNCPKMSQVNEVVKYATELEDAGFDPDSPYVVLFDKSQCDTINNNLRDAQEVKTAQESQQDIDKDKVEKAINLKGQIPALKVNVTALEKINDDAAKYANEVLNPKDKSNIRDKAQEVLDAANSANEILHSNQNLFAIIPNSSKESEYKWNTTGMEAIANAEKTVKEKAEELAKLLKEQQQEEAANKITDDKATLNDPVALCAAIMESDKSDEYAKQLAELLDKVAYSVWSYSTGHKVNQITKKKGNNILVVTSTNDVNNPGLVNDNGWAAFEANGSGHYYKAIKLLQDYAQNKKSVEKYQVEDMMDVLVTDFQGMRVITKDLEELVAKATQRDINSNNLVGLVEKANECIADPKLDNWENIVETTKSLREAIQKAQEDQQKAQEETQKPATEEKGEVITKDPETLKSAPALARTILTSSKANEEAKKLAKIVDAAYEVDKNSTGDYAKSISKIDINKAWTEFGGSGHGSYYDALKDLQDYARNTASVDDTKLYNDASELAEDMDNLRVLPDYLDEAMKQAEKAEKVAKENNVVSPSTNQLIDQAKEIIADKDGKQRELEDWNTINQLTAKLKEAAKKLTTIVKK